MDYEENNFSTNKKKFSTSLIITIVCAIIIVALIAWFALSRATRNDIDGAASKMESFMGSMYEDATSDIKSDFNSLVSDIESEYDKITSSYNDNVSKMESDLTSEKSELTAEGVSSVPYSSKAFSKPTEGEIIKDFSDKELQYSKTFGDMRLHSGIDIACKNGTAVSACGEGKIINIDESGMFGTVLTLDLGNGLTAKYSSLTNLKVKQGDTVKAGDILGVTATIPSECNDSEHLHFEVYKNGVAVSPMDALELK